MYGDEDWYVLSEEGILRNEIAECLAVDVDDGWALRKVQPGTTGNRIDRTFDYAQAWRKFAEELWPAASVECRLWKVGDAIFAELPGWEEPHHVWGNTFQKYDKAKARPYTDVRVRPIQASWVVEVSGSEVSIRVMPVSGSFKQVRKYLQRTLG